MTKRMGSLSLADRSREVLEEIAEISLDSLHSACGMWHVACGMWHVACGMLHVACGMWHVT